MTVPSVISGSMRIPMCFTVRSMRGRQRPVWRPIVAIVFAAAAAFDLQGRVIDAEALVQAGADAVDDGVVVGVISAHQVRGHRDLAGTQ